MWGLVSLGGFYPVGLLSGVLVSRGLLSWSHIKHRSIFQLFQAVVQDILPLELLPLDCLLPLDSFFSKDFGGVVLVDSLMDSFVDSLVDSFLPCVSVSVLPVDSADFTEVTEGDLSTSEKWRQKLIVNQQRNRPLFFQRETIYTERKSILPVSESLLWQVYS